MGPHVPLRAPSAAYHGRRDLLPLHVHIYQETQCSKIMGPFRIGGHNDIEHTAVHVDFYGADQQRAVSVGGGEQGGAVSEGDR